MATTPASVDKHPLHPIFVALPIALWRFSLACDLLYRFGPHEETRDQAGKAGGLNSSRRNTRRGLP